MNLVLDLLRKASLVVRKSSVLSRLSLGCIPDWHMHIKIPQIGKLRIRMRRNRSLWLRPPLLLEGYPLAALKAFIRPDDVIWDVGANIGLYALWLTRHLHARHVYSFEPMSENLPELRHNLALGGMTDRVTVVPWALCDVDGEVDFQVDDMQSASGAVEAVCGGKACLSRSLLGLPPKSEKVISRSIDSILRSGDLPAPDVLKIDVEGAERLLLDGGEEFFRNSSPRLLIEIHGLEMPHKCLEFLFDHGFSVAAFVPERWAASRHMRITREMMSRIEYEYDVHFIMASKQAEDIPDTLDWNNP